MPDESSPSAHARIVHGSRMRTRLRIARAHRSPETTDRIRRAVEQQPGVTRVEVNHATGSVLIHHEPGALDHGGLGAILRDVGIIVGGLEHGEDVTMGTPSETAATVEAAFRDLNQRVARATGGKLDLKLLVPAGFAGIGLWRFLGNPGSFFGEIPGYVLLWYAFDAYTKLRYPVRVGPAAPSQESTGESSDA